MSLSSYRFPSTQAQADAVDERGGEALDDRAPGRRVVTGTTAAELGRRYGIAKSSVLGLVRQAREQVRHPRLSTTQTALLGCAV